MNTSSIDAGRLERRVRLAGQWDNAGDSGLLLFAFVFHSANHIPVSVLWP